MEIYKNYHTYHFIRGQPKNMNVLRKRINTKSKLIFEQKNIKICVLNYVKQNLRENSFEFKSNTNKITTKVNVLEIVKKLFVE